MQLEFDWTRRERCALRNLESLSLVGVSEVPNAVVFLMQMHPDARLLDPERKITALRISQTKASTWLKRNCPPVKHLSLHPSVFRRAVLWWEERRIAGFLGSNLVMDFCEIFAWHEARQMDDEQLLAAWNGLTELDRVRPDVTSSVSEGMNSKNSKKHHSLTPADILKSLPPEVWQAGILSENELYESLQQWWSGVKDCGYSADEAIGAIFAARSGGKTSPLQYAAACLKKGVDEGWVLRAHNWRLTLKRERERILSGR